MRQKKSHTYCDGDISQEKQQVNVWRNKAHCAPSLGIVTHDSSLKVPLQHSRKEIWKQYFSFLSIKQGHHGRDWLYRSTVRKHRPAVVTSQRHVSWWILDQNCVKVRAIIRTVFVLVQVKQLEERINVWKRDGCAILNFYLTATTITAFACSPVTYCSWQVVLKSNTNKARLLLTLGSVDCSAFHILDIIIITQTRLCKLFYPHKKICKGNNCTTITIVTHQIVHCHRT